MADAPPSFLVNRAALATTPGRNLALAIAEAAVAAVTPERLMARHLRLTGDTLTVGDRVLPLQGHGVWVLGAGKAAGPMAAAVEQALGVDRIAGGAVVTHDVGVEPRPQRVAVLPGSHPLPDEASVASTHQLLAFADSIPPGDVVLWLLSGGASAILAAPAEGLTLADKQAMTRALLRCGATIDEINTVRKHLSAVKGGQFAGRLAGRRVVTLAVSDIISGRTDMIGSGPTLPDPSTYQDALAVIAKYGIGAEVPNEALHRLQAGAFGDEPETPKPGDPCFEAASFTLLAGPATALEEAAATAKALGVAPAVVLTDQLAGEARDAARFLGMVLRYHARTGSGPRVVLAAGETTVTVRGDGQGGRNQELVAALIPEIAGLPVAVACVATDGQDYVPGAAGGLVDGTTFDLAAQRGVDVAALLANNDALAVHRALGSLVQAGPTGTNVCDLVVAVIDA